MAQRVEFVGRFRKASNTRAIFIPYALRLQMQTQFGWKDGDYLLIVPHAGLLMIQRLDKSMILDRTPDARTRQA